MILDLKPLYINITDSDNIVHKVFPDKAGNFPLIVQIPKMPKIDLSQINSNDERIPLSSANINYVVYKLNRYVPLMSWKYVYEYEIQ